MADRAVPPNIQSELTAIMEAVYGEQVRGSIHDALAKMNTQLSNAILNQLIQVDNTLTLTGYGADAKKVGDLFANALVMRTDPASGTDLNTIVTTGIYRLLASNSYTNKWVPVNESGTAIPNTTAYLEVLRNASNCKQTMYYLTASHNYGQRCAVRFSTNASATSPTWTPWLENIDDTLEVYGQAADAKITGDRINTVRINSMTIGNERTNITMGANLNSTTTVGSYSVKSTSVTNLPEEAQGALYVISVTGTSNILQWYIAETGNQYTRIKSGSTWSDWKKGSSGAGESIADPFSATSSTTYAVGDYVTYKDKLWKCTSATTGGTWNASKWDEAIVMDELLALKSDVVYTPVAISSFTINPTVAEIGSTVTSVLYSFRINKVPVTLTLDGNSITPSSSVTNSQLSNLNITENKQFSLIATDNGSSSYPHATSTKTATLRFLNNRYYGVKSIPDTIDSTFIAGDGTNPGLQTKDLISSIGETFSVNAGSSGNGVYIWYAVPTRLGTCRFTVGGFEGGFEPPVTVSVTNSSGHAETYYVYRSTQDGLGETEVVVS